MTKVQWSQAANEDLLNNADSLSLVDFDLAFELLTAADSANDFLALTPRAGSLVDATGLRKWRLGQLPFALLYNVNAERLLVLRVIHLRSDWQSLL
ncbi:MAG: type II toxin-antitoxin system RelE/ParE family toxin [Sphingopyxis sp.]|nr:type II toxin-antitoxin system RelE/ParE family toxin [Sphingopyxis sp.]